MLPWTNPYVQWSRCADASLHGVLSGKRHKNSGKDLRPGCL